MALSWLSTCFLATVLVYVKAKYNQEVCTLIRESYGLSPPPLPRNFEAKYESYNPDLKTSMYSETYLDYSNTRGKHMWLERGIEHHILYDYLTEQVIEWDILHPGLDIKKDPMSHVCTATDMDESEDIMIFGLMDEMSHFPKMHNSYEMLRFGMQYQYAYDGSEKQMADRGLSVNRFVGCVYDKEVDATLAINYTFTDDAVLPSAGSGRIEVVGVDDGFMSVPVQVVMEGTIYNEEFNITSDLHGTDNYFWFKGNPVFKPETFRIPPYMYCENYRGRYDMYKMPTAFSTRVQRTDNARDILGKMVITEVASYEEVYYYKEKGLARRDFTPNPDLDVDEEYKNNFMSLEPIKTIFDFNEGIVYVTHKPTGRCYARSVILSDFFQSPNATSYVKIAEPEEVFFFQTNEIEYKGTDFVRGIECNVWTGKYFDKRFNTSFVKEIYVSTNGWHEESNQMNEYSVPVQHTMINEEVTTEPVEVISTYSFFKFIADPLPLIDFDISNCIETIPHKDFVLFFKTNQKVGNYDTLFLYQSKFEEAAQYYLAGISQVLSPLRVQRVKLTEVSISDRRPILHFTLVDKARVKSEIPVGQSGSSLEEAESILNAFIERNQFYLEFYPPQMKKPIVITALKGSLYIKTANGKILAPQPSVKVTHETLQEDLTNQGTVEEIILFSDTEEGEEKGISSAALTGLAFAMLLIGLGIGIAVMYLYIRRYNESNMEDRITLEPQTNPSNVESLPTASTSFEQ